MIIIEYQNALNLITLQGPMLTGESTRVGVKGWTWYSSSSNLDIVLKDLIEQKSFKLGILSKLACLSDHNHQDVLYTLVAMVWNTS